MTIERVSLIATVKDESAWLDAWMQGIEWQTRQPDEIVVVDGGSTDGTWELLSHWKPGVPTTVIRELGANISQGRNTAIERSSGAIVVVTDAGTVAEPNWLKRLTDALLDDRFDVAAGFFRPILDSYWSRCLAAATLPDAGEINESSFLPSSRAVAFRRSWWEAGVRYPEWLDYCEDLVWDLSLKRSGARFRTDTSAIVRFQVRPTLDGFVRQYYRYARGDGKAGLFAKRHGLRYFTYCALAVVLRRRHPPEIALMFLLGVLYVRSPLVRLRRRDRVMHKSWRESLAAVPTTIVLRGIGDVAKMAGYPVGLVWRYRTFGTLGWRSRWTRISPDGTCFQPATLSRESQRPTSWRDDESLPDST